MFGASFVTRSTGCRCTATMCVCFTYQPQEPFYITVGSTDGGFAPDLPRKNQPHYSQFNRGAYGTKRKKR